MKVLRYMMIIIVIRCETKSNCYEIELLRVVNLTIILKQLFNSKNLYNMMYKINDCKTLTLCFEMIQVPQVDEGIVIVVVVVIAVWRVGMRIGRLVVVRWRRSLVPLTVILAHGTP